MRGWCVLAVGALGASITLAADPVRFEIKKLHEDLNEGCAIADFNRDGKPDVSAGRFWYAGPDFEKKPLRKIDDWNGYVQSNGEHAVDVDGDGWIDVVSGSYLPSEIYWYKNPGAEGLKSGAMWAQKLLVDTKASQNEATFLEDLDGDGKPEWVVNSWNKKRPVWAWAFTGGEGETPALEKRVIGDKTHGHGMGFGDLNGDGRDDVLVSTGWYEKPEGDVWAKPWAFHARDWGHASCPVMVTDLDADGRQDVIVGNAHGFGLYWYRQGAPNDDGTLTFEKREIDKSFSQPHCLHLADLNGDGRPELITGKRYHAHNGKDPGGNDPTILLYYAWDAEAKTFSRHVIAEGPKHVGTGLQIRTADLNGDGKADLAVAGKSGTYVLIQK